MKAKSTMCKKVITLWLIMLTCVSARAAFWLDELAFLDFMEPGYFTQEGPVLPGHTYAGPGDLASFSYRVTAEGDTVSIVDFESTVDYRVSGVGGYFAGLTSLSVLLSDGSLLSSEGVQDGFIGFTTDRPTSLWIEALSFSGPSQPSLENFTVGVDLLLIPESSARITGLLLLGMLGYRTVAGRARR